MSGPSTHASTHASTTRAGENQGRCIGYVLAFDAYCRFDHGFDTSSLFEGIKRASLNPPPKKKYQNGRTSIYTRVFHVHR